MRFRSATEDWPSRQTMAEDAGFDPHPEDIAPPAAHLMAAPGVDVLAVFAAEVEAAREAAEARWSA